MSKLEKFKQFLKDLSIYFDATSKVLYKYSFIVGLWMAFYNSIVGTLLFIFLLNGFFNREDKEIIIKDDK